LRPEANELLWEYLVHLEAVELLWCIGLNPEAIEFVVVVQIDPNVVVNIFQCISGQLIIGCLTSGKINSFWEKIFWWYVAIIGPLTVLPKVIKKVVHHGCG